MEYISLSESLSISRMVLNFHSRGGRERLIATDALEQGIHSFLIAEKHEAVFARAVADHARTEFKIIIQADMLTKDEIINRVNSALKNLNTDYLDLLLLGNDPFVHPDETAEAVYSLYKGGKVLNFGVSDAKPGGFSLLSKAVLYPLVTHKRVLSLLNLNAFNDGAAAQCQEYEIPLLAESPLAGGALFTANDEKTIAVCTKLEEAAKELSVTGLDTMAYAWLLSHPAAIIPVIGSENPDHMKHAIEALRVKLTPALWREIWQIALNGESI